MCRPGGGGGSGGHLLMSYSSPSRPGWCLPGLVAPVDVGHRTYLPGCRVQGGRKEDELGVLGKKVIRHGELTRCPHTPHQVTLCMECGARDTPEGSEGTSQDQGTPPEDPQGKDTISCCLTCQSSTALPSLRPSQLCRYVFSTLSLLRLPPFSS